MFLNELSHSDLQAIKEKIEDGIEKLSLNTLSGEPRTHLGMSEIGKPCSRQLFYKFRWMKFEEYDGRMLRLFNRGHREENRFINYLKSIGCQIQQHDENGNQFRCLGVMDHYGGSCDGKAITPWYTNQFLLEFKTHNTNSFSKYINEGLYKTKPEHIDQMNSYGYKMGLEYAIYFPENKNDDDIQVSVLKLDWNRGKQLEEKARQIITSREPPPKISENPAFKECKFCTFKSICHDGEPPQKNCRSCRHAIPSEKASWFCHRFNNTIPTEFIKNGCEHHFSI